MCKRLCGKNETIKTNVYSVEGKIGKVIEDINPSEAKGQVKVAGELWSATSYNDLPITKDTEVIIESINGVKLIVKPFMKWHLHSHHSFLNNIRCSKLLTLPFPFILTFHIYIINMNRKK